MAAVPRLLMIRVDSGLDCCCGCGWLLMMTVVGCVCDSWGCGPPTLATGTRVVCRVCGWESRMGSDSESMAEEGGLECQDMGQSGGVRGGDGLNHSQGMGKGALTTSSNCLCWACGE